MSGTENSDGIESELPRPLMIEDTRLVRAYSVQEIAMIASGCIGDSPDARIENALDLLSAAERHASKDKWEKQREWNVKHGHSENIEPEKRFLVNEKRICLKAEQICRGAKRDDQTGKIVRTSLVALTYEESGIGKDSVSANRLYYEWLRFAAHEDAGEFSFRELSEHLGTPPWDREKLEELMSKGKSVKSADSFKARFETGKALIHDDQTAKNLVFDFLKWLEDRPKKTPPKIIRDTVTKKIVSPKNRGSAIANGSEKGVAKSGKPRKPGQFKPKKSDNADEEENILPEKRK